MTERPSKSIIRRWNREIDDDVRRAEARRNARGPWRVIVWSVLWLLWLGLLAAVVAGVKT